MVKKYIWIVTIVVALGGQFLPELGLLVPFIMLSLIVTSFFKGRYWCGHFCPHGSFFDTFLFPFCRNRKVPGTFKSTAFKIIFLLFFLFNLGRRFILVSSQLHDPLRQIGLIFSSTYLMVLILGSLLGLFFRVRTWCHFCPMGTIQGFFYQLGKALGVTKWDTCITICERDACRHCGKCAENCPLELAPYRHFNEDDQFQGDDCIRCRSCVEKCPVGILRLSPTRRER